MCVVGMCERMKEGRGQGVGSMGPASLVQEWSVCDGPRWVSMWTWY